MATQPLRNWLSLNCLQTIGQSRYVAKLYLVMNLVILWFDRGNRKTSQNNENHQWTNDLFRQSSRGNNRLYAEKRRDTLSMDDVALVSRCFCWNSYLLFRTVMTAIVSIVNWTSLGWVINHSIGLILLAAKSVVRANEVMAADRQMHSLIKSERSFQTADCI